MSRDTHIFSYDIIYEMSLLMVSNWNRKTFEAARRECLKVRQFNGIYTIDSVGLSWLHYDEYMILRDIIELKFIVSTNGKELEFKEWRAKLFCATSFFQIYKSWISLKNESNVYFMRKQKKVMRLLSSLPKFIIESMEPQKILNEMASTNDSLNKLIDNLKLSVTDNRSECD